MSSSFIVHGSPEWAGYWEAVGRVVRRNAGHPYARTPGHTPTSAAAEMSEIFARIPYQFLPVWDVRGTPAVRDLYEVDARGSAACSEAAAAIVAAALVAGGAASLCVMAVGDGAHITATVDGREYDPYRDRWIPERVGCSGSLEVSPQWLVKT